jgi:ribonuclease D
MTSTPPGPELVTAPERWQEVAADLAAAERLAVDLEGNGFFRYPERICLLQVLAGERTYLLDPLTLPDLSALGARFADPAQEKIFHSCDWDLRALQRGYGFLVRRIFDTSLAARFLGVQQAGLGNVLKSCLGVDLEKPKSLQRQDWTLRPLPPGSLRYAADDVAYLPRLRDHLHAELVRLGRWAWVEEEFLRLETIRFTPPAPPSEGFWGVTGSRKLSPRQRAVLRELYVFREGLARDLDRPPFKVMPDETLLSLAQDPDPAKANGLKLVRQVGREEDLRSALHRGTEASGLALPRSGPPRTPPLGARARARLAGLKAWRVQLGQTLGLDPSLLWPLRSLEVLAAHPERREEEFQRTLPTEVRAWQSQAFAGDLDRRLGELERGA